MKACQKIRDIMSRTVLVSAITCGYCLSDVLAQENRETNIPETKETAVEAPQEQVAPQGRMNFVKMADFYLRNGEFVFGKVVSEDKNKIVIERLDESKIIVLTYSKREVDTRTLKTKNMLEYRYYVDLGEYFTGRTWDFRDDPDDFIQAIRSYEKAKQLLSKTQSPDEEKIGQINERISRLQADREVWMREVESRATLKKLEFEAEAEKRLKELEDRINSNSRNIEQIAADMKDSYAELEENIAEMNKDLLRQMELLEVQIKANKEQIEDIEDHARRYYYPLRYYRPRHYYLRRNRSEPNKGQ